jgi:uncharacterized protein
MRFLKLFSFSCLLFSFGLLQAGNALAEEAMRLAVEPQALEIKGQGPEVKFELEVADEDLERAKGLMFRTDMPDNRAMLFVFEDTRIVSMWMKDTPQALDMLFANEQGTITHIAANTKPFSLDVVDSDGPVRYVVEIKAGLAKKLQIEVGEKLVHPSISN